MLFSILLTALASFLFSEAVGYVVHRLAHWPKSGKLFRDHLHHHAVAYPPESYTTKEYVANIWMSFLPVFVPIFLLFNAVVFAVFSLPVSLTFFAVSSVVSLVSSFMHDSFHIEVHWLDRFRWHRQLREMHRVHHKHTRKNLGIYMFMYDRLFRSYRAPRFGR